jgi:diadenylate cyclase
MDLSLVLFRVGFLSISIVDLIDIAIVAFLFFRLYAVMRGTIASQIFIGLILIAAVSFVSQTLDMKLLSWILRTVSDIWVIALVVIFQPELRRILLLIGRNGLFTTFERYNVNRVIDELVDAAEELSERHWGALIVMRRSSDITLSVDTGVQVEANISKELLISIFNPKSPLHDGAVVVAAESVRFARVVLPLSPVTEAGGMRLGTRHRAGLGISEQADVFVVIVSEERGQISYALEGSLHANVTADTLRLAMLKAFEVALGQQRGERFSIRRSIGRLFGVRDVEREAPREV